MDAQSLAVEMAPIIMWQKGQRPELYKQFWSRPSKPDSKTNVDFASNYNTWDMLAGDCKFGIICLYNASFFCKSLTLFIILLIQKLDRNPSLRFPTCG